MPVYGFEKHVFEDTTEVEAAFDREQLKRICEMHETEFHETFKMDLWTIEGAPHDADFYLHKDNGSSILAVAHLDTVMPHSGRTANFVQTQAGEVVYSGALDDRLGAYIILDLLPKLGIQYDILLTVGEESGKTTAQYFEVPEGKEYNWMIEFDRGGTDVVLYQYEDKETMDLVRASGARVGDGIFSDISYMDQVGVKGINWGVGYRDYHGPRSHAYLQDTFDMVSRFRRFHAANHDVLLPHTSKYGGRFGSYWGLDDDTHDDSWLNYREIAEEAAGLSDDEEYLALPPGPERECDRIFGRDHMHDDDECAQILVEFSDDPEVAQA
jgi:hypothetical protein